MYSPDYIILCLLNAFLVFWVIYKVTNDANDDKKGGNSSNSEGDGGIPEDWDQPILDLPPGVVLPIDKPEKDSHTDRVEELI